MQKYYSAVKTHHDYVCHKCFRQIEDCTCRFYPYSLLQIDEEIQEQIRILNVDKKYCTNGSCSGHENKNPMGKEEGAPLYVSFIMDYGFGTTIPLPEGFKYTKSKNVISYELNARQEREMTPEEKETARQKELQILLEWCKNLPVNTRRY
ncbi:hypothetical protein MSS88_02060 [bacterium]|nr:hypothetical protein [bacterium]